MKTNNVTNFILQAQKLKKVAMTGRLFVAARYANHLGKMPETIWGANWLTSDEWQ